MNDYEQHLVWRRARAGRITASNFRAVLDGGQRAWASLANRILDEAEAIARGEAVEMGSPALKWGHDHEPRARAIYTMQTGRRVALAPFVELDGDGRIGCSPDGYVGDEGLLEIKCPYSSKQHHRYYLFGPEAALAQVQGQLWITQRAWCDFVSYDPRDRPGCDLYVHRVERNEAYIASLARQVRRFADFLDEVRATRQQPPAEATADQLKEFPNA